MKNLPFLVQPKHEIVPVGSPETGIVHLLKKGGITPTENPTDFQMQQQKQADVQILLMTAVKRLAEKEGVSHAEARKRLFAAPVKRADDASSDEDDFQISMYDYLEPDEVKQVMALGENQRAIALRAATAMIRTRMTFPVVFLGNGATNSPTEIEIKPLTFDVSTQDKIRLTDGRFLQVAEYAPTGSELLKVSNSVRPVVEGEVGYLCEAGKQRVQYGWSDWTLMQTEQYLTEPQILAIFRFYQVEAGLPQAEQLDDTDVEADEEGDFDAEKSSATATKSSSAPLLNGVKSFSDSNGLELETNDFADGLPLEVNPIG
jgi:hypothetical protein